jgi:hypothetical protein
MITVEPKGQQLRFLKRLAFDAGLSLFVNLAFC